MGIPKPIAIETRSFASHHDARSFFKALLNRYRPGDRVNEADALDLAALLKRHSEYPEKVGCGIDYFSVITANYNTQCFQIVRTDGSSIDFSYSYCIDQRPR
jgi:hypothetical protein